MDSLNRPMRALRISVTDRCNFRCPYCMPRDKFGSDFQFLDRKEILTFEEIIRLARLFVSVGVEKVRLTGGEPLLRQDLPSLVQGLAGVPGLREVTLTTNGSLLASQAGALRKAGLHRFTMSLDTLDPGKFHRMSDATVPLEQVLEGLRSAREAGFENIKLNCVLKRGVNEDDILPLAAFAREQGHHLRFIEFMDVGTGNGWRMDHVVPSAEVAARIGAHWPLERVHAEDAGCVARHYRYLDGKGWLGLISSVTEPFCAGCDRARLSASGSLYTCLFASQGLDLKAALRAGADDAQILGLILERWRVRDDRYSELRTQGTVPRTRVEMFHIGG
ncbi:GTP 3',8-cyclase MoaA [Mesoterricola silvestris]|uniref:GTP 3',8-cyclase n=1 Tax=Mesoterricola silvestris TaxID=2927979 RepID=A0AA48GMU2_9BACT|nr:GTP 3',8-cyclase MoaA [Mesoterricola silvestris]BDU70890.1 cyclic pyranopterin monophosphate synthase [Mesoterricola silvestris]